jgi:hypothetical protein
VRVPSVVDTIGENQCLKQSRKSCPETQFYGFRSGCCRGPDQVARLGVTVSSASSSCFRFGVRVFDFLLNALFGLVEIILTAPIGAHDQLGVEHKFRSGLIGCYTA